MSSDPQSVLDASLSDGPPYPGMVHVAGGTFRMGSDRHYPEEAPAHPVSVSGFWVDRYAVTNEEFARFVAATGYVTVAERPADPADYPGAPPEMLVPASTVFVPPPHRVPLDDPYRWWRYVPGASWRAPRGPGSSIDGLARHPVVHVAWEDVQAYAAWAGKHLPTEAEWEFAARGGLEGAEYEWGDEFTPEGRYRANTWQGDFPLVNDQADGHLWTAPVGSFPPNGYGLHDMTGNVWEWTADWYQTHGELYHGCCTVTQPRGGQRDRSYDPQNPALRIPRKVMKGGSHLCAPNYCRRYRPAARMPQPVDTSTSHLGFRCVIRPTTPAESSQARA
jgi:sulfatase modifying factor 1